MIKGVGKSAVSPRIVAVAIIVTLAAIQWWWWKALVVKPVSRGGPGNVRQGSASRPMLLYIPGRPDVRVDTLAGTPEPGYADGPGYAARFDGPGEILREKSGSLLVADSRNHRIRRMLPDGTTSTAAGGEAGLKDGSGSAAQFRFPCGLRAQPDGTALILDAGNRRIRRLTGAAVTTVSEFPTLAEAWKVFSGGSARLTAQVSSPEPNPGREDLGLKSIRVACKVGSAFAGVDDKHSAIFLVRDGAADVIAGTYSPTFRMHGWLDGPGDKSRFGLVGGMAAAGDRTLYVSDTSNNCIRRIELPQGG